MSLLNTVSELLAKASGGNFNAGSHTVEDGKPSMGSGKAEKNKANAGTHPEKGENINDRGDDFPSGEDYQGDDEAYVGPKDGGGKAPVMHPGVVKHEGGKKSQGDPNLVKSEDEDDDEKDEKEEKGEKEDDEDGAFDDKSEKSVVIDMDEFMNEVVSKAVEVIEERLGKAIIGLDIQKSEEVAELGAFNEQVADGLVKSLDAALDRVTDLEKSVALLAEELMTRKSVVSQRDIVKSHYDGGQQLSKSEISGRLLDMAMAGSIDKNVVLKFDMTGDVNTIPDNVRANLNI